jgi:hypothetical protein
MSNEIYIRLADLERIVEFTKAMGVDNVDIKADSSSGIGTFITATVITKINDYDGEFTVAITDVSEW